MHPSEIAALLKRVDALRVDMEEQADVAAELEESFEYRTFKLIAELCTALELAVTLHIPEVLNELNR